LNKDSYDREKQALALEKENLAIKENEFNRSKLTHADELIRDRQKLYADKLTFVKEKSAFIITKANDEQLIKAGNDKLLSDRNDYLEKLADLNLKFRAYQSDSDKLNRDKQGLNLEKEKLKDDQNTYTNKKLAHDALVKQNHETSLQLQKDLESYNTKKHALESEKGVFAKSKRRFAEMEKEFNAKYDKLQNDILKRDTFIVSEDKRIAAADSTNINTRISLAQQRSDLEIEKQNQVQVTLANATESSRLENLLIAYNSEYQKLLKDQQTLADDRIELGSQRDKNLSNESQLKQEKLELTASQNNKEAFIHQKQQKLNQSIIDNERILEAIRIENRQTETLKSEINASKQQQNNVLIEARSEQKILNRLKSETEQLVLKNTKILQDTLAATVANDKSVSELINLQQKMSESLEEQKNESARLQRYVAEKEVAIEAITTEINNLRLATITYNNAKSSSLLASEESQEKLEALQLQTKTLQAAAAELERLETNRAMSDQESIDYRNNKQDIYDRNASRLKLTSDQKERDDKLWFLRNTYFVDAQLLPEGSYKNEALLRASDLRVIYARGIDSSQLQSYFRDIQLTTKHYYAPDVIILHGGDFDQPGNQGVLEYKDISLTVSLSDQFETVVGYTGFKIKYLVQLPCFRFETRCVQVYVNGFDSYTPKIKLDSNDELEYYGFVVASSQFHLQIYDARITQKLPIIENTSLNSQQLGLVSLCPFNLTCRQPNLITDTGTAEQKRLAKTLMFDSGEAYFRQTPNFHSAQKISEGNICMYSFRSLPAYLAN
jgi:hypothetical protein